MNSGSESPALESSLVTVYIPCNNYGRFLEQAIESVLSQLHTEWELIVVDDGSTDETAEVARKYVGLEPERIRFVRHEHPKGLQSVANSVIGMARGDYLFRLDADDWLDEAALLVLVARAARPDRPSIVYGGFHHVSTAGEILSASWQKPLWDSGRTSITPPHGACSLVSLRALKSVGGYSESVDAQDGWDLWFKLSGGITAANVTTPVFYYRQHAESVSRNAERLRTARSGILRRLRDSQAGDFVPRVLAVIPARESYVGMEGVPYIDINGQSLLERTILEAMAAGPVTDVMVSSDSNDVLEFSAALQRDDRVPSHMRCLRAEAGYGPHVPLSAILRHAVESFGSQRGGRPDVLVFLNMHTPTRTASDITTVIDTLFITQTDTVVTVTKERDPVLVRSAAGLRLIGNGRFDGLERAGEEVLRFNNVAIASWVEIVEQDRIWAGRIGVADMTGTSYPVLTDRSSLELIRERLGSDHPQG